MAVPDLHALGRGFHLSSTPETRTPGAFGLVQDHPGETLSEPAKGMQIKALSQHKNTLQGKALEWILMTSILFPVNFVLILGTNTGNE